jgi:hypothetical protein
MQLMPRDCSELIPDHLLPIKLETMKSLNLSQLLEQQESMMAVLKNLLEP